MLKRILGTCAALLVLSALPILGQEAAAPSQGTGETGAAGALGDPVGGVRADTDTTLIRVQQENAARTDVPDVRGPKPNPVPGENEIVGEDAGVAAAQGQAAGQADVSADAEVGGGVTERAALDQQGAAGDDVAGGAMPTTASALPLAVAGGALLMGLGFGLGATRSRG